MYRGGGTGSGKIPIIYQFFTPSLSQIYCQYSVFFTCPCMVSWMRNNEYQTHWQRLLLWFQTPFKIFCFVFHICFFYAEMPRGWCMMGHWMCVPLVKRSGNAPTSNGWLAFACLYHLSSSDIVANKRKFKRKKEDANLHPSLCWQFLYCVLFL